MPAPRHPFEEFVMKAIIGCAAAAVLLFGTAPAAAQQRSGAGPEIEAAIERSGVIPAIEEVATAAAPELERIAASIEALVRRVAEDPALRRSALRAAQGTVEVAEIIVVDHIELVREALREAAERLERAAEEIG
jgi:hypothetical protein